MNPFGGQISPPFLLLYLQIILFKMQNIIDIKKNMLYN